VRKRQVALYVALYKVDPIVHTKNILKDLCPHIGWLGGTPLNDTDRSGIKDYYHSYDPPGLLPISAGQPDQLHADLFCRSPR
jgi:hypothetical protein